MAGDTEREASDSGGNAGIRPHGCSGAVIGGGAEGAGKMPDFENRESEPDGRKPQTAGSAFKGPVGAEKFRGRGHSGRRRKGQFKEKAGFGTEDSPGKTAVGRNCEKSGRGEGRNSEASSKLPKRFPAV